MWPVGYAQRTFPAIGQQIINHQIMQSDGLRTLEFAGLFDSVLSWLTGTFGQGDVLIDGEISEPFDAATW